MKNIFSKAFWQGFKSVFLIGGSKDLPKFHKTDKEAIAADWEKVMNDFKGLNQNK